MRISYVIVLMVGILFGCGRNDAETLNYRQFKKIDAGSQGPIYKIPEKDDQEFSELVDGELQLFRFDRGISFSFIEVCKRAYPSTYAYRFDYGAGVCVTHQGYRNLRASHYKIFCSEKLRLRQVSAYRQHDRVYCRGR